MEQTDDQLKEMMRLYREAQAILEGTTLMLPTVAHLRAMQDFHEAQLMRAAQKVGRLEQEMREMSNHEEDLWN